MHPYPHTYTASASGSSTGPVPVSATGLPAIATSPPPEFDGPAGYWSPETLLTAAVADCFILTFRALSRAARVDWQRLDCTVESVLERADGVAQFTRFRTRALLAVKPGVDVDKARQLLEKAEHGCLIANSLRGSRELAAEVVVTADAAGPTA
jgi:organic hydroperoxide reductase OsmC/OhrA